MEQATVSRPRSTRWRVIVAVALWVGLVVLWEAIWMEHERHGPGWTPAPHRWPRALIAAAGLLAVNALVGWLGAAYGQWWDRRLSRPGPTLSVRIPKRTRRGNSGPMA